MHYQANKQCFNRDCYLRVSACKSLRLKTIHATKLQPFEMYKKYQNEARQACLPNLEEIRVFLTFNFSKRIHGIIFTLCKTDSLEVFYKAAVITLVEINFGKKKNDNYFSSRSTLHHVSLMMALT